MRYRLLIFIPLTFVGLLIAHDDKITVSFDRLFPSSSFKMVLDTCMQIWGDLKMLRECNQSDQDCSILSDGVIGKLARLNTYVKQMIREYKKKAFFSLDDAEYLVVIIETIANEHKDIIEYATYNGTGYKLLQDIKTQLQQLLAGNA